MNHTTRSARCALMFALLSLKGPFAGEIPLHSLTPDPCHSAAKFHQEKAIGANENHAPNCDVQGEYELTIKCIFSPSSPFANDSTRAPLILLERADLSFDVSEENYMTVSLTFRSESSSGTILPYTVYIAFDDDNGLNVVRRPLPSVDFSKLKGKNAVTFTDRIFIGVFPPNRSYTISLWIPDPDPSRKFQSAYNLLLANELLPDAKSGLNRLVRFSVKGQKPRARPRPQDKKSDP